MDKMKLPLSRRQLDIAIERLASRFGEAQRIRRTVANTILAQLMPDCVIKGGSSLKFRYGDIATRVTKDLDAAQGADINVFIARLDDALHDGWHGFTGHVVKREPATPDGVPPAYVMQPFDVKLEYNRKPWVTVRLEMGANEGGDTLEADLALATDITEMFAALFMTRSPAEFSRIAHMVKNQKRAVFSISPAV